MSKYDTEIYLNGRVAGCQYQMHITMTYGEEANRASMLVFNGFGSKIDEFTREYHHQYGREYIKQMMRQSAADREFIPGLK